MYGNFFFFQLSSLPEIFGVLYPNLRDWYTLAHHSSSLGIFGVLYPDFNATSTRLQVIHLPKSQRLVHSRLHSSSLGIFGVSYPDFNACDLWCLIPKSQRLRLASTTVQPPTLPCSARVTLDRFVCILNSISLNLTNYISSYLLCYSLKACIQCRNRMDKSQGRVQILDGHLFFLPNCSRTVSYTQI